MSGLCRYACDPNGSYGYTPLYMLKKIRKKGLLRRESPIPDPEDDDLWVFKNRLSIVHYGVFIYPYIGGSMSRSHGNPLDDDGEEEAFDDSVSDCCYFLSIPRSSCSMTLKKDLRLIHLIYAFLLCHETLESHQYSLICLAQPTSI